MKATATVGVTIINDGCPSRRQSEKSRVRDATIGKHLYPALLTFRSVMLMKLTLEYRFQFGL